MNSEKIESLKNLTLKEVAFYFAYFFSIFLFLNRVPKINDAWINASLYEDTGGLLNFFAYSINWYQKVNGRFLATFVTGFFEQTKMLQDLANAVLITSIVYLTAKISRVTWKKNFFVTVSIASSMLAVSNGIRLEVYFYASLIYLIPLIISLLFFDRVENLYQSSSGLQPISKLPLPLYILSFFCCFWLEHISVGAFAAIFLASFLVFIKVPGLKKSMLWLNAGNVVAVWTIFHSSGQLRSRSFNVQEVAVSQVVGTNLVFLAKTTIYNNLEICTLLSLGIFVYFYQSWRQKLKFTLVMKICFLSSLFLTLFLGLNWINSLIYENHRLFGIFKPALGFPFIDDMDLIKSAIYNPNFYAKISSPENVTALVLSVTLVFNILIFCISFEFKFTALLMFLVSIFSVIPICATPNLSYRVASVLVFSLVGILGFAWSRVNFPKNSKFMASMGFGILLGSGIDKFNLYTRKIDVVETERALKIKEAANLQKMSKWDYEATLTLPKFSPKDLYREASPPQNTLYYKYFLKYYGLNPDTLLAFNDTRDVLKIIVNEKTVEFKTDFEIKNQPTKVIYKVIEDNEVIFKSEITERPTFVYSSNFKSGRLYSFSCDVYRGSSVVRIDAAKTVLK